MDLERPNKEIRVGGEVEAFCTKCHRDTMHRIVTMSGKSPKKVECQSCNGQHLFRLPKGEATEEKPKAKKPSVQVKKAPKASAKTVAKPEKTVALESSESFHDELDDETTSIDTDEFVAEFFERGKTASNATAPKKTTKTQSTAKAKTTKTTKDTKAKKTAAVKPKDTEVLPEDIGDDDLSLISDIGMFQEGELTGIDLNPFAEDLEIISKPKTRAKAKPKAVKAPTIKKTKEQKRQDDLREQHSLEWTERTKAINPDKATTYVISGSYDFDQPLKHKDFGVGYVTKVVPPNKIHVKFKDSTKILITNVNPKLKD
jgi:predicted flap endonuclease-1-like 5' DNA nuclease